MQDKAKPTRIVALSNAHLTIIAKVTVIAAACLAVFFQDLSLIFQDAVYTETTSYVLVVPLLVVYLVYRKRKMIMASVSQKSPKLFKSIRLNEAIGALLFFVSFILYWYGSYTFTPLEYHVLALPIFAAACILILFNTQTLRQLIFPIAFLLLLLPPPESWLYSLGATLSVYSSELAYRFLSLFGFATAIGEQSGTPLITITQATGTSVPLQVDVACSGIHSQLGFLIFTLFVTYIIRDKLWKKTAIFILGFPLIYLINVFRITVLGTIAYYYGLAMMLDVFHMFGGWALIFIGTLIILVASEKLFKVEIISKRTSPCADCNSDHQSRESCPKCGRLWSLRLDRMERSDIVKIFALVLGILLIVYAQAPVFALTQGPAEIILGSTQGRQTYSDILPPISNYTIEFRGRNTIFEQTAQQDACLEYAYYPTAKTDSPIYVTIEIAATRSSLHNWETCLITWPLSHGYQASVNEFALRDVALLQNPPIVARYFEFQYVDSSLNTSVLYWFETTVFKINNVTQQKQVKISLILYPSQKDGFSLAEDRLKLVGKAITASWQPLKTWSELGIVISQNGDRLIEGLTGILAVVIAGHEIKQIRVTKRNKEVYSKLSSTSKRTIDAVYQAESEGLPTLTRISDTFAKTNGKITDIEEFRREISLAEKTGLVKSGIANVRDEPTRIWRTAWL